MSSKPRTPGPATRALGWAIGEQLRQRGMTQSRLAELSGIPDPTLSQIVNGRRAIDAEQVNRIAKALKRRPSYLWQQAERRLADEEDLP